MPILWNVRFSRVLSWLRIMRLRYGDCGFLKRRNGIPFPTQNLGTWRGPLRSGNGRLSTGMLFGCGQTRGRARGSLERLLRFVRSLPGWKAFIIIDGIRGVGLAKKSKSRLNSSGCSSKRLKILRVLGAS